MLMPNVFREKQDYKEYIFSNRDGFYVPDEVWKEYVVAKREYLEHADKWSKAKDLARLDRYCEAKLRIREEYESKK